MKKVGLLTFLAVGLLAAGALASCGDGIDNENKTGGAFCDCTGLKTIVLGSSMAYIATAFQDVALEKVYAKCASPYGDSIELVEYANEGIINATWYYFTENGAGETASGSWWYYDTDGTIKEIVNE